MTKLSHIIDTDAVYQVAMRQLKDDRSPSDLTLALVGLKPLKSRPVAAEKPAEWPVWYAMVR